MPCGLLNRAPVPVPSTDPVAPGVPAIVVTRPPAVTFRIVWFPESVTNRSPPRAAIPPGNRNCAAGPVPSADPGVSRTPARVLTVPAEVTLRIVWFPVSVTNAFPPPPAPPAGMEKRAVPPVPSSPPVRGGLPARVVATPAAVTWRTTCFPVPAPTHRLLPPGAVPLPEGLRNSDPFPVPSANPGVPAKPTRVVTTPLCVTFRTVWFPVSHRNSEVPSLVIPEGDRKRASGPVPSAEPGVPDG